MEVAKGTSQSSERVLTRREAWKVVSGRCRQRPATAALGPVDLLARSLCTLVHEDCSFRIC